MSLSLQTQIAEILGRPIKKMVPLSGGDISKAYLVYTAGDRFFCKRNDSPESHKMFLAEREGLEAIAQTRTMRVPSVVGCGNLEVGSCLILEYIEPGHASTGAIKKLGHQLAALHSAEHAEFGWPAPNYIGSLHQSNRRTGHWASFYLKERLLPQLKLALNGNRLAKQEVPPAAKMMEKLQQFLPAIKPSLLHGDLWGGNYLISAEGIPYLIDPAVYYGHQEVDLAMTRLFGEFDAAFYLAYDESIPPDAGWQERTGLYQLYYLLVHLNLFGKSYYHSVQKLLRYYF